MTSAAPSSSFSVSPSTSVNINEIKSEIEKLKDEIKAEEKKEEKLESKLKDIEDEIKEEKKKPVGERDTKLIGEREEDKDRTRADIKSISSTLSSLRSHYQHLLQSLSSSPSNLSISSSGVGVNNSDTFKVIVDLVQKAIAESSHSQSSSVPHYLPPPTVVFTVNSFNKCFLEKSSTWNSTGNIHPWWPQYLDTPWNRDNNNSGMSLVRSKKLMSLFRMTLDNDKIDRSKGKYKISKGEEPKLQLIAMEQYEGFVEKKQSSDGRLLPFGFINTSNKGLQDSTRKPDISLVMRREPKVRPNRWELCKVIELKVEITESHLTQHCMMIYEFMLADPTRDQMDGCVTNGFNLYIFIAVMREKLGGGQSAFTFRKSQTYDLNSGVGGIMSDARRTILSWFYYDSMNPPLHVGYDKICHNGGEADVIIENKSAWKSFCDDAKLPFDSTKPFEYSTKVTGGGGTSDVLLYRPLSDPLHSLDNAMAMKCVKSECKDIFEREVKTMKALNGNDKLKDLIPTLLFSSSGTPRNNTLRMGMVPFGVLCGPQIFTYETHLPQLVTYSVILHEMKLVDLDIRNSNIMCHREEEKKLLKVDFGGVVIEGKMCEYHGTDRFCHPEIMKILETNIESAASIGPSIIPRFAYALHSIAATYIYWHSPRAFQETLNNPNALKDSKRYKYFGDAWQRLQSKNLQVANAFQAAEAEDPRTLYISLANIKVTGW